MIPKVVQMVVNAVLPFAQRITAILVFVRTADIVVEHILVIPNLCAMLLKLLIYHILERYVRNDVSVVNNSETVWHILVHVVCKSWVPTSRLSKRNQM